jgi:NAD(P)-dependent dehydrogenase (short-subunit alcohol dehydrogenase family)
VKRLKPKPMGPPLAYAASKLAVSWWAREQAVKPDWAGAGIRMNVLAPGATMTPLLREQLEGPNGRAVRNFPMPGGGPSEPGDLADIAVFMLSPAARVMVGTVIFADGGTDALLRGDHYPAPVRARQLGRYGAAMVRFKRGK